MQRIAVVDDSHLVRTTVGMALSANGFETLEIEPLSMPQVIDDLKAQMPDLLILDLLMPTFNGLSLVRCLRRDAALKDLKVVIASAHLDEDLLEELHRFGILGFLKKPSPTQGLIGLVKDALGSTSH